MQLPAMDFVFAFHYVLLLLLPTVTLIVSPQFERTLAYASFLFGDSLVDAGNNDYIFTLSKADSPPYGIDFAASNGKPTGRFTNGRTVSDIIDEELGAKTFPPPYLASIAQGDAMFGGVNYASGSSGILNETGTFFIGRLPLQKQIDYFEKNKAYMIKIRGMADTSKILNGALFSVITGSNDFLNYFMPSIVFLGKPSGSPPSLLQDMISNFTIQLQRLQQLGARRIVVVGVGPLGCIPFIRAINRLPIGLCSSDTNRLIKIYNQKLKMTIYRLNEESRKKTLFVYANAYDIFQDIILHYREYGFTNGFDPCCGGNLPLFLCFTNSSSGLCQNRSKYVFWDAYHPTEAVNMILARRLLDGDDSVVTPMNIRQLYNYRF